MVRHYRRKQAEKQARQMSQGGTPATPQAVPEPPAPQH
jgi:hypothetical protein